MLPGLLILFRGAAEDGTKVHPLPSDMDEQTQSLAAAGQGLSLITSAILSRAIPTRKSEPIMLPVEKQPLFASSLFTEKELLVSSHCRLIPSYNRRKRLLY